MERRIWVVPILVMGVLLAGCQQRDNESSASHSKPKTVITSKQYTMVELQKRYQAIVDTVVKPLEMASYSQPAAEVKQAASEGTRAVDRVKLQLASNTSQPEATKALQKLAMTGETMLTAINGTDQEAYSVAAKDFMAQTAEIAKAYFDGQIPQRLMTYSQRMSENAAPAEE